MEGIADFPMHRSSVRKTPKGGKLQAGTKAIVSPQSLFEMYHVPADSYRKASTVSQGPVEMRGDDAFSKDRSSTSVSTG